MTVQDRPGSYGQSTDLDITLGEDEIEMSVETYKSHSNCRSRM